MASKIVTEWLRCIGQKLIRLNLRHSLLLGSKAILENFIVFLQWFVFILSHKLAENVKTDACIPWDDFASSSSVAWRVVIIFICLSTLDIRFPFISVLLFIASIRRNNAIDNNIDKQQGKSQKLLGKALHWDDDLRWDSIFTHAKQLLLDYLQSSNFTPRIPFQLGIGLFIIWE